MTELPPGLQLYQLGIGHYVSRAMYLAAKLDLAGHIARGARDFRALAKATDTDAPSLQRVLRLLASVGIFEERENGEFALTPLGDVLRDDAPGSMRASVMLFTGPGIQEGWGELEYCVRTGEPAYRKLHPDDADAFANISRDPEAAAIFDKAMATFAPQTSAGDRGGLRLRPVRSARRRGRRQRRAHDRDPAREPAAARARLRPAARDRARARARRVRRLRGPLRAGRRQLLREAAERRRRLSVEARDPRLERREGARDPARRARGGAAARQAADRRGRVPGEDRAHARGPRRRGKRREHAGEHRRPAALRGGVPRPLRSLGLPPHRHRADASESA